MFPWASRARPSLNSFLMSPVATTIMSDGCEEGTSSAASAVVGVIVMAPMNAIPAVAKKCRRSRKSSLLARVISIVVILEMAGPLAGRRCRNFSLLLLMVVGNATNPVRKLLRCEETVAA